MIERSRLQTINHLAVPIVGGMLSQNVFNLVDTAMVGVLGPTALAAVGIGTFANFMAISLAKTHSLAVDLDGLGRVQPIYDGTITHSEPGFEIVQRTIG